MRERQFDKFADSAPLIVSKGNYLFFCRLSDNCVILATKIFDLGG